MPGSHVLVLKEFDDHAFDELAAIARKVKNPHGRFMTIARELGKYKCSEAKLMLEAFEKALARLGRKKTARFTDSDKPIIERARRALKQQGAEQAATRVDTDGQHGHLRIASER